RQTSACAPTGGAPRSLRGWHRNAPAVRSEHWPQATRVLPRGRPAVRGCRSDPSELRRTFVLNKCVTRLLAVFVRIHFQREALLDAIILARIGRLDQVQRF